MCQLEGLTLCCLTSFERDLCEENEVLRILKAAEDLSCLCDELKRMCSEISRWL